MAIKQIITFSLGMAALVAIFSPALAGSNTDIAFVSPAGSDANNCVWLTPFDPPHPPACKTATHAATLLHGPGSALEFLSGTYHEMASIHVSAANWPSAGGAFRIGVASGANVLFDGGGFVVTGDGWVSLRGIKMQNCPADCITASGNSMSAPLHGIIANESVYSGSAHAVAMMNTINFELGYNFFKNTDKAILYVVNSPNYNIHETSLLEDVKKVPQIGGYVVNSPNGLFDTHIDAYTGPTALSAVNSPGLHDPIVDTPRMGNVCPASDVATDTFSSSWTKITSNGCITQ